MDISLLNLEYFLAVAEELAITRAADKLHISPQSLSKHMQRLEEYFDAKLFVRSSPLRLTRAGEELVTRARQLLETKESICADIMAIGRQESSAIRLGIVNGRSAYVFADMLAEFSEKHPDIRAIVSSGNSMNIAQEVEAGRLDLGILALDAQQIQQFKTLEMVKLYDDPMYICATEELLLKYCGDDLSKTLRLIERQGTGVLLESCPATYIHNRVMSSASKLSPLSADSFSLTSALCLMGVGLAFCARSQLPELSAMQSAFPDARLHTWVLSSEVARFKELFICRYRDRLVSPGAEKLWRHIIRASAKKTLEHCI